MRSKTTAVLCLFISVLAGLATHASGEVRLTIKEVTNIRPTHDGRYFGRASLQVLASEQLQILSREGDGGLTNRSLQFRIVNGDLAFIGLNNGNVQTLPATIPTSGAHAFVPNDWFHAAVTYDGDFLFDFLARCRRLHLYDVKMEWDTPLPIRVSSTEDQWPLKFQYFLAPRVDENWGEWHDKD